MSDLFNDQFNDHEKNLKNVYLFPQGKQASGFFGDNSRSFEMDCSPRKNIFANLPNSHSGIYSLKTNENTEANFKNDKLQSNCPHEFKILTTDTTKMKSTPNFISTQNNTNHFNYSNNEILFSGYFGQKNEMKKIFNDQILSKNSNSLINPFTNLVEEDSENFNCDININSTDTEMAGNIKGNENETCFEEFLNYGIKPSFEGIGFPYKDISVSEKGNSSLEFNSVLNNYKPQEESFNKNSFNNLVRSVTISSLNAHNNNDNINNKLNNNFNFPFNYSTIRYNDSSSLNKKKSNYFSILFIFNIIF